MRERWDREGEERYEREEREREMMMMMMMIIGPDNDQVKGERLYLKQ